MYLSSKSDTAIISRQRSSLHKNRLAFRLPKASQKEDQNAGQSGYVQNDNSGKGNIFPNTARPFISSPTSSAVASSGLGGIQGGAVLAAAIGVVGLATVSVLNKEAGESMEMVISSYNGETLAGIAARIAASL
ncbi:hypothetical protein CEUSTIGMA_g2852.t1 [Chlamydomonas eustigma]|uniref:Uncharacterized protein n=1 Tax=Chlamydomonas eustigma TaxID=1157962 RepID=A0A250WX35_9CHLO|nr:hypothetical protein CEUSTIGMA_g2852.t1 [Chlamydomonas eustigma]|eukprot:GAX75408.1 hypothetical protein CEUSTIGMA_g2852.t1 [Chlamydomonas eustigma]